MNKTFFNFYVAIRFLSLLAERVIIFAVPVAIYIETKSLSLSGFAYMAQWLPQVVLLPFLGHLTGRFAVNRQFVVLDVLRAVMTACIFLFFSKSLVPTVIIVGGITLLSGYGLVVMETFISHFVAPEDVAIIQARLSSGYQASLILGPALGAWLLSVASLQQVLAIAALLFLLCALMIHTLFYAYSSTLIRCELPIKKPTHERRKFLRGFKVIFSSVELKHLIIVTACVNFVEGIAVAQLPAIANVVYGVKASAASMVLTSGAIISLTTFTLVSLKGCTLSIRTIGIMSMPLMVIGILFFPLAPNFTFFILIFSVWVSGRSLFTLWMRSRRILLIPKADAGPALSIFLAGILAGAPLSGIAVALLADRFGPMHTFAVCAGAAMLVSLFVTLKNRMHVPSKVDNQN